MPELVEQMYCSQQIVIPPKFPYVLKRYCKAAIKTQPYDLLRWSFEYFLALAEHRPPPVKLRLEYPIYSSEGGLTRGCLKVLAQQLNTFPTLPLSVLKRAWQGFCLDPNELKRIFCLCEVYKRADTVPFLHFIAVAGGTLTKCLTHTMILLCESLTKEPDGGSAAIPYKDFLTMYSFLADMDASRDIKYYNGYREGQFPVEENTEEDQSVESEDQGDQTSQSSDEGFWQDESAHFKHVSLIDGKIGTSTNVSKKTTQPLIGHLERSPSVERAKQIERETYIRDRKGRAPPSDEVERKLKKISVMQMERLEGGVDEEVKEEDEDKPVDIRVYDEEENEIEFTIYGEPVEEIKEEQTEAPAVEPTIEPDVAEEHEEEQVVEEEEPEWQKVAKFIAEVKQAKKDRLEDFEQTLDEIKILVDRFKSANYDLGMVAGRQMSTTSGEFIVQHIEQEILAYIDEQIAILPDPDLKKKKAKPEEVEMIRDLLEKFIDDNMDIIVPEVEEVEEEESPIPEITIVYAVPGIGPQVDLDIVMDFKEYIKEVRTLQADVIMPRNIRHYLCPPLEKLMEYKYPDFSRPDVTNVKIFEKKEQAAVGGTIAE
ncbi:unnamed protein product [Arctia plantaginis]|uniref:Ropporin-1-like protein n=1 Tax=Arctia plantaginis TaxID=874455 RepID=A0A8S0ZJ05_ARCPL|nr:unnamed protein product [Arctia plantaginis]